MNIRTRAPVLTTVLCVLTCSVTFTAYGQLTVAPTPLPQKEDTLPLRDKITIATLRGVIQSIEDVEKKLQDAQAVFDAAEIEEQKAELAEAIKGLLAQRTQLQQDFEEIATGLDLVRRAGVVKPIRPWHFCNRIRSIIRSIPLGCLPRLGSIISINKL